jgi:hypothetical protein
MLIVITARTTTLLIDVEITSLDLRDKIETISDLRYRAYIPRIYSLLRYIPFKYYNKGIEESRSPRYTNISPRF